MRVRLGFVSTRSDSNSNMMNSMIQKSYYFPTYRFRSLIAFALTKQSRRRVHDSTFFGRREHANVSTSFP